MGDDVEESPWMSKPTAETETPKSSQEPELKKVVESESSSGNLDWFISSKKKDKKKGTEDSKKEVKEQEEKNTSEDEKMEDIEESVNKEEDSEKLDKDIIMEDKSNDEISGEEEIKDKEE